MKEQNKVVWWEEILWCTVVMNWTFSGVDMFFSASVRVTLLPHCYHCWATDGLLLLQHVTQHHKMYQSQRAIERNVKSCIDLLLRSSLKTGNGPSHPATRRGWWGSLDILYCCRWRGLRWGHPPWPSEPVPPRRRRSAPPDCPCWSPGCWGEECDQAETLWKMATEGGRRGLLLGCRGTAVLLHQRRSRRSAPQCWSRPQRSHRARWCGRGRTGPGRLRGKTMAHISCCYISV